MFTPYSPCKECKHKDKCKQCSMTFAQENYHRALKEIVKLSAELGKKVTILV